MGKTNSQLSEAELRYKTLFEQSPDGIAIIDTSGKILEFNETAHRQLGYSKEEFAALKISDIDAFESPEETRDSIRRVLDKGRAEFEVKHRTKEGDIRDVQVITQVLVLSGQTVFHTIWRDITERKKAEGTLKGLNARLQTLIRAIPDIVLFKDTEGRYLIANKTVEDFVGLSQEELIGRTDADLLPPDLAEACKKSDEGILKSRKSLRFEEHFTGSDGENGYFDTIKAPIFDSHDNIEGIVAISRDVTERKQIENKLAFFRDLINKSNDAIFVNDPQTGLFIIVNDKACISLGYDREELLKLGVKDIETTFPDNFSWEKHVNELRQKASLILEGVNRRKDGSTFPVETNVSHVVLNSREYMVAVVRDITDRKAYEQKLKKSEERMFKAQKIAHVGNWEWDIAENSLYWSDEVYRIYGRDAGQFIPSFESVKEAMHPDDLEPFTKAVNAAMYEGKPFEMDYRLIRPDGTERTVHTIGEVTYDLEGKPLMKGGTVQDITESKKTEEALRHSREFVKNILDTVDEAFIVIDGNYRIIMANSAYSRQAKMPVEDIIGKHCYEISHHSLKPCYEHGEECAVRHSFEKGEPYTCLHRHIDKAGNAIYVETKSYPLKDSSGKVTSAIEVINNITDKHLLEEQILRTQKLEAVGLLAGGIAHDFNNLLQGVFGNISMAKMLCDKDSAVYQMLEEAERALNLSRNLTRQLLTFSKGGEPVKRVISLPFVIQDAVKFSLSGSNVRYTFSVDENLWTVEADEGQISQVINNIVLNASDAMPEGGTIRIHVRNVLIDEKSVLPLAHGKYVMIAIEDSGIGIPNHHIHKIFDPYFTTKQKGSGLGLATSYSIIKKHDGVLNVTSEFGAGSTFSIYLPATEKKLPIKKAEVSGLLTGRGRILVMDDEEIIRVVTGQMLRTLGYEVVFAENGEQAVEKYSEAIKSNKPFDAVILDLTIRGGSGGQETVKKMIEIDPAIKAIVSSGYTEGPIVSNYMDEGFKAILSKPYEIEELSKTLNRILMVSDT